MDMNKYTRILFKLIYVILFWQEFKYRYAATKLNHTLARPVDKNLKLTRQEAVFHILGYFCIHILWALMFRWPHAKSLSVNQWCSHEGAWGAADF